MKMTKRLFVLISIVSIVLIGGGVFGKAGYDNYKKQVAETQELNDKQETVNEQEVAIENKDEDKKDSIKKLYTSLLSREASEQDITDWIDKNIEIASIENSIKGSWEYRNKNIQNNKTVSSKPISTEPVSAPTNNTPQAIVPQPNTAVNIPSPSNNIPQAVVPPLNNTVNAPSPSNNTPTNNIPSRQTCPNGQYSDGKGGCVTADSICKQAYGQWSYSVGYNSAANKVNCDCTAGYEWQGSTCIVKNDVSKEEEWQKSIQEDVAKEKEALQQSIQKKEQLLQTMTQIASAMDRIDDLLSFLNSQITAKENEIAGIKNKTISMNYIEAQLVQPYADLKRLNDQRNTLIYTRQQLQSIASKLSDSNTLSSSDKSLLNSLSIIY